MVASEGWRAVVDGSLDQARVAAAVAAMAAGVWGLVAAAALSAAAARTPHAVQAATAVAATAAARGGRRRRAMDACRRQPSLHHSWHMALRVCPRGSGAEHGNIRTRAWRRKWRRLGWPYTMHSTVTVRSSVRSGSWLHARQARTCPHEQGGREGRQWIPLKRRTAGRVRRRASCASGIHRTDRRENMYWEWRRRWSMHRASTAEAARLTAAACVVRGRTSRSWVEQSSFRMSRSCYRSRCT
jgi:hypothetical protein